MSEAKPSNDLLLIRCPSCGQRFNVDEEFRGRLVECGECDHQFEINDSNILRGKKFYPGERKDPLLEHVPRTDKPIPQVQDALHDFTYAPQGGNPIAGQASPFRALVGVIGVFIMIVSAAFLIMGAAKGGVLDQVTTDRRLIMAAFSGILGSGLLVFANPNSRLLTLVIGSLLTCGLCALPFVFKEGSVLTVQNEIQELPPTDDLEVKDKGELSEDEIKDMLGLEPLENEITRLENEGSTLSAVGLWLRNLQIRNRLLIRDFIIRETGADLQTHFYNRSDDSTLMVVTGVSQTPEEMAIVASALGKVENVYTELSLVEVLVDNQKFLPGPVEKMTNTEHPDFYLLNKIELESIDLDRVSAAVKRIVDVEPALFRRDISGRLIKLLQNDWVDFKDDICRALLVWAEEGDTLAGEAALEEIIDRQVHEQAIPEDAVALAVKQKTPGMVPLLHKLWRENPAAWERWVIGMGTMMEPVVMEGFSSYHQSLRQSAVRILGEVGGKASLQLLEGEVATENMSETKILLRNAVRDIKRRHAVVE